MKIGYFPPPSKENSYTIKMFNLLGTLGYISVVTPKKFIDFIRRPKFDYVFINWLENKSFRKNGSFSLSGFLYSITWFLILKIKAKKIVYVKHNNYPHNTSGLSKKLGIYLIRFFVKYSNIVIVHSPASVKSKKINYIPHPLYDLHLNDNASEYSSQDKNEGGYYTCFGRIERYKKIDELIKFWPSDIPLIIQGLCHDKSYLSQIIEMSKGKNINISTSFISDEQASKLLKESKGVIIPSDSESMIVSGTFFFAITVKTPIIAINSDFFRSIKNNEKFMILIDSMEDIRDAVDKLKVVNPIVTDEFLEEFSDERIICQLGKLMSTNSHAQNK